MEIHELKQILKTCSDDTRLRILNLINSKELTVKVIASTLDINPSVISKHLARLRFQHIVIDRREGSSVYYIFNKNLTLALSDLIQNILARLSDVEICQRDKEKLQRAAQLLEGGAM
jgi:DNA-binding transcriptional ArsR family regulator